MVFILTHERSNRFLKINIIITSATTKVHYFNINQLYSTRILLYTEDGDKYTGQWTGWAGQGEINYKDGKKYIGQWEYDIKDDKFKRHLRGTLYSADGQVLNQGLWDRDKYVGKE